MSVTRSLAAFAALNGAMAVALGAFAAHGAGPQVRQLLTTGAHYQLAHALLPSSAPCGPPAGGWSRRPAGSVRRAA